MKIIYALTDPRDNAVRYVGITRQDPKARLRTHVGQARFGMPQPISVWIRELLDLDLTPDIIILEETDDSSRELYWINAKIEAGCDLLNIVPSANAHWRGRKLSAEHRAAISAGMKGHAKTKEHRAALSASLKGRPKSDAHCAALGESRKGRPISPEHRAKISAALRGRPKSPEHVAKVADAQRGKSRNPLPPEQRAKISTTLKGRKKSSESIAKRTATRLKAPQH